MGRWKPVYAAPAVTLAMASARYIAISTAYAANNDAAWGPWMMYGYGGWQSMGWSMLFGGIFWLAVLALIVVAVAWLVRSSSSSNQGKGQASSGLEILAERYARGEINREEYLGKKRDLLGKGGA